MKSIRFPLAQPLGQGLDPLLEELTDVEGVVAALVDEAEIEVVLSVHASPLLVAGQVHAALLAAAA